MTSSTENRIVFLRGFKTILRPVCKETDLDFFLCCLNNPEIAFFLNRHWPITQADEETWFNNLSSRKEDVILAIEDIEKPGIIIGNIGLHRINWTDRTATTGAVIGNKEYWSRGYGTDAKMILLNYAFNELNLRKICSRTFEFNDRSIAYSKKCGYHEEGRLESHIFRNGQYWDDVLLAVFREEFLPVWEEYKKKNSS